MPVSLRIIPCLDVHGGRVVKGVNFMNLRDAGDPVELAGSYGESGADELVFLDISASSEGRETTRSMVARCAETVFIPLCVGGGVQGASDVDSLLRAGADKVGVNTAAVAAPELITEISSQFGNQVLVLSVDARRESGHRSGFGVTTHGGRNSAGLDVIEWVREATDRGAGEILLNSMDADGTTDGFDLRMLEAVREATNVPIIASGGAGRVEHFVEAARAGADAVLAASVFHYGKLTIQKVKDALRAADFEVR